MLHGTSKLISLNEELLGRADAVPLAFVWLHCDVSYVHKNAITPALIARAVQFCASKSRLLSTLYDLIWTLLPIYVSDV
jgi:hypothetical protein